METSNIVMAPQIADVDAAYAAWKANHVGSKAEFLLFMTRPSVERQMFVNDLTAETAFAGKTLSVIMRCEDGDTGY